MKAIRAKIRKIFAFSDTACGLPKFGSFPAEIMALLRPENSVYVTSWQEHT